MVPSVVKIKKGNVEYTSRVDIAKYTIQELTRRALMDVGRYVSANVRRRLRGHFPFARGGRNAQRYQYWVRKREGDLLLGIENVNRGAVTAWWADQLELDKFIHSPAKKPRRAAAKTTGEKQAAAAARRTRRAPVAKTVGTPNNPRRHILETFAKTHIDTIIEIESRYLSKINDEDAAIALAQVTEEMEVLRGDEN